MVGFTGSGEDRLSFSTLTSCLPTPDPTSVLSSLQRRLRAGPALEQDSTRRPPKSVWWTPGRAGLRPLLTRTLTASSQSLLCLCPSWVLTVNLPRCRPPTAGHCVPLFLVPRLRVSAVLRPIPGSRWAPPGTHSVDAWGPHTQER